MTAIAPSGRQYVIRHKQQEAVITEVGGGLRAYRVNGHDVVDGYAEDEMCSVARGAPLIPWPNRLRDGRYEFRGVAYQTPITEPAKQNAIHGLTRWLSWDGTRTGDHHVRMSLLLHPQEGYPFTLSVTIDYELSDQGLAVRTTATNAGNQPLPYGSGQHPYLTVGTERVDQSVLRLPALLRMEVDERQIPTGRLFQVEGTDFDFLEGRPIGASRLDTAFTGLIPEADGVTRILLKAPDSGRQLTLWVDRSYSYLMVFSGDSIPDAIRRRRSLALEPMTCAPDAFRSGLGLITVEPGKSVNSAWGIFAVA